MAAVSSKGSCIGSPDSTVSWCCRRSAGVFSRSLRGSELSRSRLASATGARTVSVCLDHDVVYALSRSAY